MRVRSDGFSFRKVVLASTLIEAVGWTCIGTELRYFLVEDATQLINQLFEAVTRDFYFEVMQGYGSEWTGRTRLMLDSAFDNRGSSYPVQNDRAPDGILTIFDTALMLAAEFVSDVNVQRYIEAQSFINELTWEHLDVVAKSLEWAQYYTDDSSPPFWIPGYLNTIDYFTAFRELFSGRSDELVINLRSRLYDLHRWRLNLRSSEVRRRFSEATAAVAAVIDLIEPPAVGTEVKDEVLRRSADVDADFSEGGTLVAGVWS